MSIEEFESIGGLKGILERHEKQKGA
jgi:hypothetical protein